MKRVLVIGWDGAGSFVQQTATPNLDAVAASGVVTYSAQTVQPTISAQCWGSLLHGVVPEKHQLTNDRAASSAYPADSPYPSYFKLARTARQEAKLAAFAGWKPIVSGIIEEGLNIHKLSMSDGELAFAAADYVRSHPDFACLFVQFDLPDYAGHKHGYGSQAYLEAITQTDRHTGLILQAVREMGLLDDSLVIITTDHGGGGVSPIDHGSDHPLDTTVFWACSGPGIRAGSSLAEPLRLMDTAAVVAHAMGLDMPSTWDVRLPEGLFIAL